MPSLQSSALSIPWGLLKRAWTGVQVCFDPKVYSVAQGHTPEFHLYPPRFQKNWTHVATAAASLMVKAFRHPCSRSAWQGAAQHLYESLSGPFRTDGLLTTHLEDRLTRNEVLFVATHIESFDRDIATGQLDLLCEKVQQLRSDFPNKTIVIAADFNWHVGAGDSSSDLIYESIAGLFKRRLGAVTMPMEDIRPTLVGKHEAIDGVFFITPEGQSAGHVRGLSLWPGAEGDVSLELSDHHSVIGQLSY